jgi:hypothetical protein
MDVLDEEISVFQYLVEFQLIRASDLHVELSEVYFFALTEVAPPY